MGAGLIVSLTMLKDPARKSAGFLGILAHGLLLAGDFITGAPPSAINAAIVGSGYMLLLVWFAFLAVMLAGRKRPAAFPGREKSARPMGG